MKYILTILFMVIFTGCSLKSDKQQRILRGGSSNIFGTEISSSGTNFTGNENYSLCQTLENRCKTPLSEIGYPCWCKTREGYTAYGQIVK